MVVSINRNDNIFDPQVTDELNSAFFQINNMISNYKSEPLEHKYTLQYVNNSNSFIAENLLCVRESFISRGVYGAFTEIDQLPRSVPYDVWGNAVSESSNTLTFHIKDKSIYIFGNSEPNEKFNIVIDIVLP